MYIIQGYHETSQNYKACQLYNEIKIGFEIIVKYL